MFHLLQNNSLRYLPGFGPVVPQECGDCGKKFNMGGPIWSAPIHDQEWVTSILADVKSMKDRYPAYDRISAVLTTISEVCFFSVFLLFSILLLFCLKVKNSHTHNYSTAYLDVSTSVTDCRNCLMFLCS